MQGMVDDLAGLIEARNFQFEAINNYLELFLISGIFHLL